MKKLLLILITAFSLNTMAAHFQTGSSVPTAELKEELNELYNKKIKNHKVYEITIEGHTDSRGGESYNQKLSEKRAKAAYDYLIKLGLKSRKSKIVGRGEFSLLTYGLSLLDHSQNRRVVITVKSDKGTTKTVISECKEKRVYKKNAVKLYLGYGPNDLERGNNRADLDSDPFVGIGYQRMLNEDFSLEAIGTTNESLMIGGGYHF